MSRTDKEVKEFCKLIPRGSLSQNTFKMSVGIRLLQGSTTLDAVENATSDVRNDDVTFEPQFDPKLLVADGFEPLGHQIAAPIR